MRSTYLLISHFMLSVLIWKLSRFQISFVIWIFVVYYYNFCSSKNYYFCNYISYIAVRIIISVARKIIIIVFIASVSSYIVIRIIISCKIIVIIFLLLVITTTLLIFCNTIRFLHSHPKWECISFMRRMTIKIFMKPLHFETLWVRKNGFYESICLSVCLPVCNGRSYTR